MISVIIPVYNVEPYLRKCLDSIVHQTYRDLEILIIDDGSTDGSGKICDEYAEIDERAKVFHTENKGLSCARNLGLDNATGDWIGFVDSDDWIEPDMYEMLLIRAEEKGADVVECGVFTEYPKKTEERKRYNREISGMVAVQMLLRNELSNDAWSKLWRRSCFTSIRFPEKRVYEDVATTYRIFAAASRVCTIANSKYHYLIRKGSISNSHNMQNLAGYWQSVKERADFLWNKVDEDGRQHLIKWCALAVARTWAYYYDSPNEERQKHREILFQMNAYSREHIKLFGDKDWDLKLRVGSIFPHYYNALSFKFAWIVNRISLYVLN